ncbi:unnamed protein product [Jaminaea pallidilutea]
MLRRIVARGPPVSPPLRLGRTKVVPNASAWASASASGSSSVALFSTSSSQRKRTPPRSPSRQTSNWELRRNELAQELSKLESRIDDVDKRQQAKEAVKDLPELDEAALDAIYAGVIESDPISVEDKKMLEAYERKTMARLATFMARSEAKALDSPQAKRLQEQSELSGEVQKESKEGHRSEKPSISAPRTFEERSQARLTALSSRLSEAMSTLEQQGQDASSAKSQGQSETESKKEESASIVEEPSKEREREAAEVDKDAEGGADADLMTDFETISLKTPSGDKASPMPSQVLKAERQADASPDEVLEKLVQLVQKADEDLSDRSPILSAVAPRDWSALGVMLVERNERDTLAKVFYMLENLSEEGHVDGETLTRFYEAVADSFATRGESVSCEAIVARMGERDVQVTSLAYHSLAKSYLRDAEKGLPHALTLLNQLEETPTPASQATYSIVMRSLLDQPGVEVQDQAWDLWYRMRLNAHPKPDATMWSSMLRACALGSTPSRHSNISYMEGDRGAGKRTGPIPGMPMIAKRPAQTEAAMDLFHEMTVVEGIRASPACYDRLIFTLCKDSGSSSSYLEGFKIFGEMISLAKESGLKSYEPTRMTYNALLEGCLRQKDIVRSRWVIAEMIRSSAPLWSHNHEGRTWSELARMETRMPDAESLGKLFLTYAAWRPPSIRLAQTRNKPRQEVNTHDEVVETDAAADDSQSRETSEDIAAADEEATSESRTLSQPAMDEAASEFSSRPPATSAEVVRELRGLLSRAIADQAPRQEGSGPSAIVGPFSRVEISTRLLNAYLNALSTHLPRGQRLATLLALTRGPESLFARLQQPHNGRTMRTLLQACTADASIGEARSKEISAAADWAWSQWRAMEDDFDRLSTGQSAFAYPDERQATRLGVDRRTRELTWLERIRFLSKQGQLDKAMATLREFVDLYPPKPLGAEKAPDLTRRRMPFFDFRASMKVLEATGVAPPKLTSGSDRLALPGAFSVNVQLNQRIGNQESERQPEAAALTGAKEANAATTTNTATTTKVRRRYWLDANGRVTRRGPSLSFYELNPLHQRLVEAGRERRSDLAFLGWVCKTWDGTNFRRQGEKIKAR